VIIIGGTRRQVVGMMLTSLKDNPRLELDIKKTHSTLKEQNESKHYKYSPCFTLTTSRR
jgi:hypothetical protein